MGTTVTVIAGGTMVAESAAGNTASNAEDRRDL
jgi:hypothetical protein